MVSSEDANEPLKDENVLTLCPLGNFLCFLSFADFFFKINFFSFEIFFQEYNLNVKQIESRSGVNSPCRIAVIYSWSLIYGLSNMVALGQVYKLCDMQ